MIGELRKPSQGPPWPLHPFEKNRKLLEIKHVPPKNHQNHGTFVRHPISFHNIFGYIFPMILLSIFVTNSFVSSYEQDLIRNHRHLRHNNTHIRQAMKSSIGSRTFLSSDVNWWQESRRNKSTQNNYFGSKNGKHTAVNSLPSIGNLESIEECSSCVYNHPEQFINSSNPTVKTKDKNLKFHGYSSIWDSSPYFITKRILKNTAKNKLKNKRYWRKDKDPATASKFGRAYSFHFNQPNSHLSLDSEENEEKIVVGKKSVNYDARPLTEIGFESKTQSLSSNEDFYVQNVPQKIVSSPSPTLVALGIKKSASDSSSHNSSHHWSSTSGSLPRHFEGYYFEDSHILEDDSRASRMSEELNYQQDEEILLHQDQEMGDDIIIRENDHRKNDEWRKIDIENENGDRNDLVSSEWWDKETIEDSDENESFANINENHESNTGSRIKDSLGSIPWQQDMDIRTFKEPKVRPILKEGIIGHTNPISGRHKRKIGMDEVQVVEGGLAALPCDLNVSDENDSVQLILWIKEGLHTPLYSYDYRELKGGMPKETKPDANSTLARRTTFRMDRSPAVLLVEKVEGEDGGIYRCRVDFLLSPTINKRVNLTVIVPPSRVRVTWHLGGGEIRSVTGGGEAGPFLENSQPTLICSNDDGWPPASVVWYEGDEVLDDSFSVDPDKELVENELNLSPLTRMDLGRRLTCVASNTNATQPATMTITLTMILKIMGVKVTEVEPLWANEMSVVECKIWGSTPPPSTVWWLGSLMLPPTENTVIEEGNVTLSYLHFKPVPKDDGAMLICQATNEKLPDQAVQDSRLITVNYAPIVKVKLGKSLDPEQIKEGGDVYFECDVVSKPPVSKVIWKHNGMRLVSGPGVILSNMSLVVQGITRSNGGNYTCHATNIKDTSTSPPLHLDVKYTPVCASDHQEQHSVGKLENAEISCKVHANPGDVTFRWTFNNTAEAIDVPDGRFVVVGTESRVNYTPMNELDYGTLLCWANNSIGMQQHPCVFNIVAAGKPDPPHNCRVFDVTISSLQVTCLAGDDGGLSQEFLLQVYQIGSKSPVVEKSRHTPSFSVANLQPATSYKIVIAAINHKGQSRLTELKAYTVKVPETQEETSAEPTRDRDRGSKLPVAVMIGISVAVIPAIIMVGVVVWLKLCRKTNSDNEASCNGINNTNGDTSSSIGIGDVTTHSAHSKDAQSTELASDDSGRDDRNPDLISHTQDPMVWSTQCGVDMSTISTSSSYLLTNGGGCGGAIPTYNTNPTLSPAAMDTNGVVVDYSQLIGQESGYGHLHVQPQVVSSQLSSTAEPAVSQVPYYIDPAQQQPSVEVELPPPPPPSYNQGYPTIEHQRHQHHPSISSNIVTSQSFSTLERRRRGCPQQSEQDADRGTSFAFDVNQQALFPHLYQNPTGSLSKASLISSSQYSLSQVPGNVTSPNPVSGEVLIPVSNPHGSLRRVGSKKGVGSDHSRGVVPLSPRISDHIHHPLCDLSQHKPVDSASIGLSEAEAGLPAGGTLKGLRRKEKKLLPDGQESQIDSSNNKCGSLRKSKRESAV